MNAISAQNLILPAGTQKIDTIEYFVKLNASPTQIEELNDLPIRARNGGVLYVRDVAHVRDGYPPQTNIARVDGKRAVVHERAEDRQRLHPRHHQRHQAEACRACAPACRRS